MGAEPPKILLRGSEHPQILSSVNALNACFSADYVYSWDHAFLLFNIVLS